MDILSTTLVWIVMAIASMVLASVLTISVFMTADCIETSVHKHTSEVYIGQPREN